MIPPAPGEARRETNSWNKDCGRRAIIPIKMMNDIPLPIPLSVILSPSHRINILPAAKMMVEVIIKNVQSNEALSDGPACILRLSKYEGAWKTKIAICQYTSILIDFSSTTFTFTLDFLKVGNSNRQKLNYN